MFAITGITGQVGGATARALLKAGRPVRAVVRDAAKAQAWAGQGCEIALADMNDAAALTAAFTGAEGVFVLLPPNFAPTAGFPETRAIIAAVQQALLAARPGRVVCLSTIGAQATQPNLLNQLGVMEQVLGKLPMPVAFLRAAWFIENAAWDVAPARENGVVPSYLQPLDRAIPMVATADIGRVAAELLQAHWTGTRTIELEGARRVSANDLAAAFATLLGRPVVANAVPRQTWEATFKAQGMADPTPRMQMLDGFNEGWIAFEGGSAEHRTGTVEVATVLADLITQHK
jgi:uncharacterized protein YbjT (DUF2867 family)